MMASQHVPDKVIRQQLASAINIVVHCTRLSDGTRKVTGIAEVVGVENDLVEMQDIFEFERTGISPRGKVLGSFRGSGDTPDLPGAAEGLRHSSSGLDFRRGARGEGEVDGQSSAVFADYACIFSVALFVAGYYVWTRPGAGGRGACWEAACANCARICAAATRRRPELLRREHRGQLRVPGRPGHLGGHAAPFAGDHRTGQPEVSRGRCVRPQRAAGGVRLPVVRRCSAWPCSSLRLLLAAAAGLRCRWSTSCACARGGCSKFEEQLPDAIDLFTRTMRAGHNIHSGLETIATETADPVRMEFRKLMEELALGSQVEPALHGLGKRVPLHRPEVLHHQPDPAAADRRQHGGRAGEPLDAGARAPEHGGQAEGAHRAAALFGRPAVLPAAGGGHRASGF